MKVSSLQLTNLRPISSAVFRFQPGFNLIVGVNGVGKSSVLDALSVCLSAYVKEANGLRVRKKSGFSPDDIRIGANVLSVECVSQIGFKEYRYLIHIPRETSVPQQERDGLPREQVYDTFSQSAFWGDRPQAATGNELEGRPLAVLFSTNRAVPSRRAPSKRSAAGGPGAAFGDALSSRELRLGEIAAWMRAQGSLMSEYPSAATVLVTLENTVRRFLEGYTDLRVDIGGRELLIDREDNTVKVWHMSDGERGILALVLDLTRRLVQANPEMDDPTAEAEAVVLIDEIELHLHPSWQRSIVSNLESMFPRCQFIATTHSPQVIGEVDHKHIHIMTNEGVYSPTHSFGVDSSRLLEEVMDAESRTVDVRDLLLQVSSAIGKQNYNEARDLVVSISDLLGEIDPEVTRIQTLLDFLEDTE
ncbi:MAG: AAA family ATPase [Caldilineaceae bacterium]|nr:AAA family ATPase [Caldilineaceae bacterium]